MRRSINLSRDANRQRVAVGFSWGAFFFGPLWAIYRRLWLVFVVLFVVSIPLWFVDELARARANHQLAWVSVGLSLAYMLVCGAFGNRWRRWTLERHGYIVVNEAGNELADRFISQEKNEENTRRQLEMTPQTLAALLKHGFPRGKAKKLEFFFYTDATAKADALADELEHLEYSVKRGPSAGDESILVITGWTVPVAIDEKPLLDWTRSMCEIGYKHDCEFDGWGTHVE